MLLSAAIIPLLLLSGHVSATTTSFHHRRSGTPAPRSYDTHTYYALELPEGAQGGGVAATAHALGVELVEPLGELEGYWLVRRATAGLTERGLSDPVVERFNQLRDGQRAEGHLRRATGLPSLRSIEVMVPKQRTKRQYPAPVPPESARRSRRRGLNDAFLDDEKPRDDTELLYLQGEVGLKDPLLPKQWHFANQADTQWELNVTRLWKQGITGKGVKVVIVDDGLDMTHEDLAPNYYAAGSYDFNDHSPSPAPRLSDDQHGTRCAGEVAAAPNDVCGVGVAYNAQIAGVRILSGPITDADEAEALNYKYQENEIFSCSWGPPDDGRSMEAPNGVILKSMVNGVQKGRGGKGSLFVFAAGNGGGFGDQCNFDGYTNSIFSVTVGAVDHTGRHPYYSERCSAMMVVAPSSGSGNFIHTTDVGPGKCASTHGGTSAAAPLMAGVLALALQVRPELTWRDVQHICVNHAVMLHPEDEDWESTASGRKYSYKYGYGRIDAHKFVDAARDWKLVKPQAWFDSPAQVLPFTPAPARPTKPEGDNDASADNNDGINKRQEGSPETTAGAPIDVTPPEVQEGSYITPEGVTSKFTVTEDDLARSNFARLEHVTVRVWIKHDRRGDVAISLKSPNGIVSMLADRRSLDEASSGFDGWKFMTLKHWDESPVGDWEITVKDTANPDKIGFFQRWALQLWGEVVDEQDVRIWSPAIEGQADEEEVGSNPTPKPIPQKPKPTQLLPTGHGGELPASLQTTADAQPTGTADEDTLEDDKAAHPAADEGVFDGIDGLRKHSAWVGGAFLIVILAALGAGGFFLLRERRRRARLLGLSGSRGAYAPVAEDEHQMTFMERSKRKLGLARGGERSEETKELYDAFGDGPSDSEDGDEDRLRYHDQFLDDEHDEHDGPVASGSGSRDHDYDDDPTPQRSHSASPDGLVRVGESNSSGSWQDAADDVRQ